MNSDGFSGDFYGFKNFAGLYANYRFVIIIVFALLSFPMSYALFYRFSTLLSAAIGFPFFCRFPQRLYQQGSDSSSDKPPAVFTLPFKTAEIAE